MEISKNIMLPGTDKPAGQSGGRGISPDDIIIRKIECGGHKCVLGNSLSLGAFLDVVNKYNSNRTRLICELKVHLRRGPGGLPGSREEQNKKLIESFCKCLSGFHVYEIQVGASKTAGAKINFHIFSGGEERCALSSRAAKQEKPALTVNLKYGEIKKCIAGEIRDKIPQDIRNGKKIYARLTVNNRAFLSLYKDLVFIPAFRLSDIRFSHIPDLKKEIEDYLGIKPNTEIRNSGMAYSLAVKIQARMAAKYPAQRYFYFGGEDFPGGSYKGREIQALPKAESFAVYLMAGLKKQCVNLESIMEYCEKPLTLITGREGAGKNCARFLGSIMNIYEESPTGDAKEALSKRKQQSRT